MRLLQNFIVLACVVTASLQAQITLGGGGSSSGTNPVGGAGAVQTYATSSTLTGDNTKFSFVPSTNALSLSLPSFGKQNTVLIEPLTTTVLAGSGNFDAGRVAEMRFSGTLEPADYGNTAGQHLVGFIFNGRNSADNSDKKTQIADSLAWNFQGSGQRFGRSTTVGCYGMGDCGGQDVTVYSSANNTAPGDEGTIGQSIRIFQVASELDTTISASVASSCNTTLTANVAKSSDYTDVKTVTVASVTGCVVGDYLTIAQGAFDGSSDNNVETIKLTAVGIGSITAIFQQAHLSGTPVQSANVLTLASMPGTNIYDSNLGQGRFAVITDGASYSTGTIASVTDTGVENKWTIVGSGTTWTTAMVGGRAGLVGCIAFASDTTSVGPFASTPLKSWYPIITRNSNTSLTIYLYTGAATSGNYEIRPCARIGLLPVTCGGSACVAGNNNASMTIQSVVLEYNTFDWAVGKTFHQAMSPWATVQHALLVDTTWYGPAFNLKNGIRVANDGYKPLVAAFTMDAGNLTGSTSYGFRYGLDLNANTQAAVISAGARTLNGIFANLSTKNTPPDYKYINWNTTVGHGACVGADDGSGRLLIQTNGCSGDPTPVGLAFDASALTIQRIITWGDKAGMVGLTTGTLNADRVAIFDSSGRIVDLGSNGITASGTSCTITAITKGVITGATCTP